MTVGGAYRMRFKIFPCTYGESAFAWEFVLSCDLSVRELSSESTLDLLSLLCCISFSAMCT